MDKSTLSPALRIFTASMIVGALVASTGCDSDDDAAGAKSDPAAACDSMCKGAGFSGSNVDSQPHETNCFCTGTGTVSAAVCTDMCSKATGKPGKPFRSGGNTDNACQCQ